MSNKDFYIIYLSNWVVTCLFTRDPLLSILGINSFLVSKLIIETKLPVFEIVTVRG